MAVLCASAAVIFKTGPAISGAITSTENFDFAISGATGQICAATRVNWVDVYATIDVDTKFILEDVCSSLAAIPFVAGNMYAYPNVLEAEDLIVVLRDNAIRGMAILRDQKAKDFINVT